MGGAFGIDHARDSFTARNSHFKDPAVTDPDSLLSPAKIAAKITDNLELGESQAGRGNAESV